MIPFFLAGGFPTLGQNREEDLVRKPLFQNENCRYCDKHLDSSDRMFKCVWCWKILHDCQMGNGCNTCDGVFCKEHSDYLNQHLEQAHKELLCALWGCHERGTIHCNECDSKLFCNAHVGKCGWCRKEFCGGCLGWHGGLKSGYPDCLK